MNNAFHILTFSLGAAVGSVVTWRMLKRKYEQLTEANIAEIRAFYSKKSKNVDPDPETKSDSGAPTIREYAQELSRNGYRNYSGTPEVEEEDPEDGEVFVISPEEFGENDEYETKGLTYYADGVLADDMDDVVEDVEDLIGKGSLNRIGEYADDAVYVRNVRMRCDYEVIASLKNYTDVFKSSPHRAGV